MASVIVVLATTLKPVKDIFFPLAIGPLFFSFLRFLLFNPTFFGFFGLQLGRFALVVISNFLRFRILIKKLLIHRLNFFVLINPLACLPVVIGSTLQLLDVAGFHLVDPLQ